jgi:hypothetical protein
MSATDRPGASGAQHATCTDSLKNFPDEEVVMSQRIRVVTATDVSPIDLAAWARAYARTVLELYREQQRRQAA